MKGKSNLQHKRFIEEYFRNLHLLTSQTYLRAFNIEPFGSIEVKSQLSTLEQVTECYYHIEAFNSPGLTGKFQILMRMIDSEVTPVLREPDKHKNTIYTLRGKIAKASAEVITGIDDVIFKTINPEDYK